MADVPWEETLAEEGNMKSAFSLVVRVATFVVIVAIWGWVRQVDLSWNWSAALIWGGPLVFLPASFGGRWLLDRRPTTQRTKWINAVVHYAIMALLGAAIVEAMKAGNTTPGLPIPLPSQVGMILTLITGLATALTVINLAVRGLGAPFAVALSRRLAQEWLYSWTRNPMILTLLACLASLGLWFRSAWFVAWVLVELTPLWLLFVKVYEERELEIRFGQPYLDYKARTPLIWPRRPRRLLE